MGNRSPTPKKKHGLTGKPSNNSKPKAEQATRNIGIRVNDERWQQYHDGAKIDGKKLTKWLTDLADERITQQKTTIS